MTAPAFATFAYVYLRPPVAPAAEGPRSVDLVGYHAYAIATNADADAWRVILAFVLALGPLLGIAFARMGRARALISREPGWLFFLASGIVATTLGGLDHDRFDVLFLPFLLIVAFAATDYFDKPIVAMMLTLLMALGSRVTIPLASDDSSHFAFFVSTIPAEQLVTTALIPASCCAAAAVLWLFWQRRESLRDPSDLRRQRSSDDTRREEIQARASRV